MKQVKIKSSLGLMSLIFQALVARGEIRETATMGAMAPEVVNGDTIIVFDLDNTVMEPIQTLGSDQFFGYLMDKAIAMGLKDAVAINWALGQASWVQPISRVRPVEPGTPNFIRELERRHIPVMALTARPIAWARNTLGQLSSIGVDFTRSPVAPQDMPAGPGLAGRYLGGVLFMANGGDKGQYLVTFLQQIHAPEHRVLFLDDKLKNVQSVEAALANTSLEHISFRYAAADSEVRAFDRNVADLEWSYFQRTGKFISDGSARNAIYGQH